MEWITTTAKTLPDAIDLALDNLGVDESEAEIVVVEEPKQGFFGRPRGVAKVEARVKPKPVRNKFERSRKSNNSRNQKNKPNTRKNNNQSTDNNSNRNNSRNQNNQKNNQPPKPSGSDRSNNRSNNRTRQNNGNQRNFLNDDELQSTPLEEVAAYLKEYMSNLVSAFGYEDTVTVTGDAEIGLTAEVEGQHGLMVGQKGRTLNAIQELVRVSAQRSKPSKYRIYVDVGGYRQKRREALTKFSLEVAEKAREEGQEIVLDPMNSSDRKIIHDALTDEAGVETRSSGDEPRRRVVVVPVEQ